MELCFVCLNGAEFFVWAIRHADFFSRSGISLSNGRAYRRSLGPLENARALGMTDLELKLTEPGYRARRGFWTGLRGAGVYNR